MDVSVSNIVGYVVEIAGAVVTVSIPIVVPALLRRLHVANDADLSGKLIDAANAAAGAMYHYALQHEQGLGSLAVRNSALAHGIAILNQHMSPDDLERLGYGPDSVAQLVQAKLGELLAGDPTVSAGTPNKIPAGTSGEVFGYQYGTDSLKGLQTSVHDLPARASVDRSPAGAAAKDERATPAGSSAGYVYNDGTGAFGSGGTVGSYSVQISTPQSQGGLTTANQPSGGQTPNG